MQVCQNSRSPVHEWFDDLDDFTQRLLEIGRKHLTVQEAITGYLSAFYGSNKIAGTTHRCMTANDRHLSKSMSLHETVLNQQNSNLQ